METRASHAGVRPFAPGASVDALILLSAFAGSFATFVVGNYMSQGKNYFSVLLWIIAFILLAALICFLFRYRRTLREFGSSPSRQKWFSGALITVGAAYALLIISSQVCAVGMYYVYGEAAILGTVTLCGVGTLVGYFISGLTVCSLCGS